MTIESTIDRYINEARPPRSQSKRDKATDKLKGMSKPQPLTREAGKQLSNAKQELNATHVESGMQECGLYLANAALFMCGYTEEAVSGHDRDIEQKRDAIMNDHMSSKVFTKEELAIVKPYMELNKRLGNLENDLRTVEDEINRLP